MGENGAVVVALCLIPLAYLLGTFPSADLVARRYGIDVTKAGSGNPGASNVIRLVGWKAGVVVLLADAAKGAIAAGVGLVLDGHRGAWILGTAAVVGHVFPVWRRFKGGKGVATGAGVFAVVFPLVTVILAAVWFFVTRVLKKASIASVVVALIAPFAVWFRDGTTFDIVFVSVVAGLLVLRHASNLRRLVRGEEHGLERPPAHDDAASAA